MILSLSEISTVGASFAEDVEAYAAAGFDAIGLWEFKLPDDDEANIALLREHGLRVAVCVPAVPSVLPLAIPGMEGPADPAERIDALEALRRAPRRLRAGVRRLPRRAARRAARRTRAPRSSSTGLRRDRGGGARRAGVRIGFEPVHVVAARAGGLRQLARRTPTRSSHGRRRRRSGSSSTPTTSGTTRTSSPGSPANAAPGRRRPRQRLAVARSHRPRCSPARASRGRASSSRRSPPPAGTARSTSRSSRPRSSSGACRSTRRPDRRTSPRQACAERRSRSAGSLAARLDVRSTSSCPIEHAAAGRTHGHSRTSSSSANTSRTNPCVESTQEERGGRHSASSANGRCVDSTQATVAQFGGGAAHAPLRRSTRRARVLRALTTDVSGERARGRKVVDDPKPIGNPARRLRDSDQERLVSGRPALSFGAHDRSYAVVTGTRKPDPPASSPTARQISAAVRRPSSSAQMCSIRNGCSRGRESHPHSVAAELAPRVRRFRATFADMPRSTPGISAQLIFVLIQHKGRSGRRSGDVTS